MLLRRRKPTVEDTPLSEILTQYAVAVVASAVAIVVWRVILKPVDPSPFPLLLAAVAVSALFGGLWPGLMSLLVTVILAFVFYVESKHHNNILTDHQTLELYIYAAVAGGLNWLIALQRASQVNLRNQLKVNANITRNLGEGVYAVDDVGRVTFMNPAAERLLGYPEKELKGKNLHEVIHTCVDDKLDDGQTCPLPQILRAASTVRNADDMFLRKDGSTLPVSYTCAPVLTQGVVTGAVMAFRDISDRKRAVDAMRASEERYQILVETSHDSIWLTDLYGYIIMANERAATLYGYLIANDMLGMNSVELIAPDDRLRSVQDRRGVMEGAVVTAEYMSLRRDGTTFPSEVGGSIVRDEDDQPRAILNVVRDITDRRKAHAALQSSESRLAMQFAATSVLAQSTSMSEAIPRLLSTLTQNANWDIGLFWTVDLHDNVLRCRHVVHGPTVKTPEFRKLSQQLTFASGVDLPGRVWETGEAVWIEDVVSDDNFPRALMASKEGLHGAFAFPIVMGDTVHSVVEFFSFEPMVPSSDTTQSATVIATQIAQFMERMQAVEMVEYHALHDSLTELPNRTLIQDRLELALSSAHRNSKPLALMLMDLDLFKEINDTFGHRVGDLILKQIGPRLKAVLRDSDTVGRLGGDEFAVILPNSDASGAALAAPKLLSALQPPIVVEGRTFDVRGSIGIACFPEHGDDGGTLLRRADVAMYVAKHGKIGYVVYDTEHDRYSPDKLALKRDLRSAIENDEFVLFYQPKVDLVSDAVESVEALVRWQHPEHGLIGPDQFIALAEQNDLLQVLSLQILSSALRQCHAWHESGLEIRVAVNFSTSSLEDPQFVGMISGMLKACEVPADHLEVEITESAIMVSPDVSSQVLERLHTMGVHISIDDFGTGHSSLAQLKRLPADQIKIDRSIISDMATSDEDSFITRSIIDLGHRLGLRVVAEGVEDQETSDILATLGCDLAQGTFLSPPMAPEEISRRLRGPKPRLSSVS
jgi:diguanylate cyclase (GGDEF)-like protein/PAS domain S-box-containing protein